VAHQFLQSGGEYGLSSGIQPSSRDIATLADDAFWLSEGTNLAPGANTYGINVLEFDSSLSSGGGSGESGNGGNFGGNFDSSFEELIDLEINGYCASNGGNDCLIGTLTVPEF